MQNREEASQKRNLEMMELHRLETESRLEQQRKDMDLYLEQQRMDMATIAKKIVQNVVNQVLLIVQNVLLGLRSVLNVAPLQLKGSASLQPSLMLTKGTQIPQGSGTSTRGDSSRKKKGSPSHLSAQQNSDKERSLSPPNLAVEYEAITMDVDDVPQPTDAPIAG